MSEVERMFMEGNGKFSIVRKDREPIQEKDQEAPR